MLGTIELDRRESEEPLTITEINGSVLLRISAVSPSDAGRRARAWPGRHDGPDHHRTVGQLLRPRTAESKKTFIIPIGFAVGDDEPTAYVITFDDPTKQLLNGMINESCGLT